MLKTKNEKNNSYYGCLSFILFKTLKANVSLEEEIVKNTPDRTYLYYYMAIQKSAVPNNFFRKTAFANLKLLKRNNFPWSMRNVY